MRNPARTARIEEFDFVAFLEIKPVVLLQLLAIDAAWAEDDIALIIRSRDSNDDHLLTAATSGRADFLVSGDIDVLELAGDARLGNLRIVSPRDFALELRTPKQ